MKKSMSPWLIFLGLFIGFNLSAPLTLNQKDKKEYYFLQQQINNFQKYASDISIYNCIITSSVSGNGFIVKNNVFASSSIGGTNNFVTNNIFYGNPDLSKQKAEKNIFGQNSQQTFENVVDNQSYNYKSDYNLRSSSPGKNAGSDGKDIGLYGGYGWKNGALPIGPNITDHDIAAQADTNGKLRIKVTVKAQEK